MPYLNRSIHSYEGNIYHVYARGANKCLIFQKDEDKKFFLYLLKKYLQKDFKELRLLNGQEIYIPVNSVYYEVELQAFCLMDNHFHLLVFCKNNGGIEKLMRRILSVYSQYFNCKYERQGNLFQGSYRSVLITNENHLNIIGVYIHTNPEVKGIKISNEFSSLHNYQNNKPNSWLHLNQALIKNIDFNDLAKYRNILDIEEKEKIKMGIV